MGYHGSWISTDQVPQRAITEGLIARFGTLNPTDGGTTQRYSLNIVWEHTDGDVITQGQCLTASTMTSICSPTSPTSWMIRCMATSSTRRRSAGWWVAMSRAPGSTRPVFGKEAEYTVGFQTRNDFINPIGLYNTEDRQRLSTVSQDSVFESSIGLYADTTIHWTELVPHLRGRARATCFTWMWTPTIPKTPAANGTAIMSPKLSASLRSVE